MANLINREFILQSVKDNMRNNGSDNVSVRDYIENEAQNDPGFFRWLFNEELEEDFDASLTSNQREDYEDFLNSL